MRIKLKENNEQEDKNNNLQKEKIEAKTNTYQKNDRIISQLNKNLNADIPFSIDNNYEVQLGQEVFSYGYPLGEDLGTRPSFSDGRISALEGFAGDNTKYRISNPIQGGNSGGPLVDNYGRLIGIIVSSLDEYYGTIPQNVNFAVKIDYLSALKNTPYLKDVDIFVHDSGRYIEDKYCNYFLTPNYKLVDEVLDPEGTQHAGRKLSHFKK